METLAAGKYTVNQYLIAQLMSPLRMDPRFPPEGGGIKTFQTPLPFALLGMLEKV